jgi:hypothetical protein
LDPPAGGNPMKKFLATAATAAILATGGVAVAGAADSGSTTTTNPPATTQSGPAGARAAHPRVAAHVLALTAETIGIERADLVAEPSRRWPRPTVSTRQRSRTR